MNYTYKALVNQSFHIENFSIVPIRMEDRYEIMKWRNEQIFHLRQNKPLTRKGQDAYFENEVTRLFRQDEPSQILFSFLENETCIGYGGLVHINWVDKNAEISFITESSLIDDLYQDHLSKFLTLLEIVAFKELEFHKLYTYAFDVRPKIYPILEKNGFEKEATLKEHCLFNGDFKNVVIHVKFNRLEMKP